MRQAVGGKYAGQLAGDVEVNVVEIALTEGMLEVGGQAQCGECGAQYKSNPHFHLSRGSKKHIVQDFGDLIQNFFENYRMLFR